MEKNEYSRSGGIAAAERQAPPAPFLRQAYDDISKAVGLSQEIRTNLCDAGFYTTTEPTAINSTGGVVESNLRNDFDSALTRLLTTLRDIDSQVRKMI